jgi:hypothetical protein
MANKCSYTKNYYDWDLGRYEPYKCPDEEYSERRCKFHFEEYAADEKNRKDLIKLLKQKVKDANKSGLPLKCIGYYLPSVDFREIMGESFSQPVYFTGARFYEGADFSGAKFLEEASFAMARFSKTANFLGAKFSESAHFSGATFSEEANFIDSTFPKETFFLGAKFLAETYFLESIFGDKVFFKHAIFGQPNKVIFDDNDLSNVSFAGSDITRIRFGDKITWRREQNEVTIIEEEWLKRKSWGEHVGKEEDVSLDLVLSVYRNLRENFEFRLKFDDAGKLFIKEMELRRKYGEVPSISDFKLKLFTLGKKLKREKSPLPEVTYHLRENCWFRRNFSLTGLYYHLSRYGESISRPALIGAVTLFLSTLFWLTQSNPTLEPHFDPSLAETASTSTFVGFREIGNATQWLKGFERSLAGFIPLLSLGGETKVGIIDYIIKIFGGALTFVLLAIALRRKFERKYTR